MTCKCGYEMSLTNKRVMYGNNYNIVTYEYGCNQCLAADTYSKRESC